jgi:RNA polymerase sigma-54 factor
MPDVVSVEADFPEATINVMKEKGYTIARRTVAKYREQLNIPVARLRKEIQ